MEKLQTLTLTPSKLRMVPRGKKPPMPAWLQAEVAAEKAKRSRRKK